MNEWINPYIDKDKIFLIMNALKKTKEDRVISG